MFSLVELAVLVVLAGICLYEVAMPIGFAQAAMQRHPPVRAHDQSDRSAWS